LRVFSRCGIYLVRASGSFLRCSFASGMLSSGILSSGIQLPKIMIDGVFKTSMVLGGARHANACIQVIMGTSL
jgi:hypothetical protein